MSCSKHSGSSHLLKEDPVNMATLRRPTLVCVSCGPRPIPKWPADPLVPWDSKEHQSAPCQPAVRAVTGFPFGTLNVKFSWHRRVLGRFRWPRGLTRGSAAVRLLELRVKIPLGTWISVSCGGLWRTDSSSRGVLPSVACQCVWSGARTIRGLTEKERQDDRYVHEVVKTCRPANSM